MGTHWSKLAKEVHGCLAKDHTECTEDCTPDTYTPHWMTEGEVRELFELANALRNPTPGKKRPKTGPKPEEREPEAEPGQGEDGAPKSGEPATPGDGPGEPAEASSAEGTPDPDATPQSPTGSEIDKIKDILKDLREKGEFRKNQWQPGPATNEFEHKHHEHQAEGGQHHVEAIGFREFDYQRNRELTKYRAMCSCGWEDEQLFGSMGGAITHGNRHINQMMEGASTP